MQNISVKAVKVVFSGIVLLCVFSIAFATTPQYLNYQGRLADANGHLVGGAGTEYDFRFTLYSQADCSGGTKLWPVDGDGYDNHGNTSVINGVFNLIIGTDSDLTSFDWATNGSGAYLQVEVKKSTESTYENLCPRLAIVSAPQALNADKLDGHDWSEVETAVAGVPTAVPTATVVGTISLQNVYNNGSSVTLNASGSLSIANASATPAFFIDQNTGNVGIGTTAPGEMLAVAGDAKITGTLLVGATGIGTNNGQKVAFRRNNATSNDDTIGYLAAFDRINSDIASWYLGVDTDSNAVMVSNNADMRFGRDYGGTFSEYMRIQNDTGNVGIGITNPSYKLQVNGQPAANGYTAFTNYSDERLKTDISRLGDGYIDKIMELKPSTYKYNALTGYDDETRSRTITGFIAQDLQKVSPEMVGKNVINGTEYLDTNLSSLPIYMVKALQEQQEQITSLQKKVSSISRETPGSTVVSSATPIIPNISIPSTAKPIATVGWVEDFLGAYKLIAQRFLFTTSNTEEPHALSLPNGVLRLTTGTLSEGSDVFIQTGAANYAVAYGVQMEAVIRINQTTPDQEIFVGLGNFSASDPRIGFVYVPQQTKNWLAQSCDGTSCTTIDIGSTPEESAFTQVSFVSDAQGVHFFINNEEKGVVTNSITPQPLDLLIRFAGTKDLEEETMDIDRVTISQSRELVQTGQGVETNSSMVTEETPIPSSSEDIGVTF